MSVRFPRVASLPGAAGLRARLEELGCPLPCDDEILSAPDSPLAHSLALPPSAPGGSTESGTAGREPLGDPTDGGLGRNARGNAHGAHPAALAALRAIGCGLDLGRRGGGGARRRTRQPPPAAHRREYRGGHRSAAARAARGREGRGGERCGSGTGTAAARRPAAHPQRSLVAAHRGGPRAAHRLPAPPSRPASRRDRRHRAVEGPRTREADRRLRPGSCPRPVRRLRLRRPEALPRLPAPRIPRRAPSTGPLRGPPTGGPHPSLLRDPRCGARCRPWPRRGSSALGIRPRAASPG